MSNPVFWALLVFSASTILAIYGYFAGKKLNRDGIRVKAVVLDRWVETSQATNDNEMDDHTYYVKAYFDNEEGFQQTIKTSVPRKLWKKSADEIELIYLPGQAEQAGASNQSSVYHEFIVGLVLMVISGAFLVYFLYAEGHTQ